MKGLVIWIFLMGLALGVETAGWRISVDKLVEGGLKNPKVKKMEKAPAESAFFEAGDELWDLSGAVGLELWGVVESLRNVDPFAAPDEPYVLDRVAFRGEWLVWNASSGVIVGRTTLAEMALIEDTLDLSSEPFHLRTTMEVGAKSKEKRVSLISRSGEKAMVETESIDLDVATNVDQDLKWLDLQLVMTMDAGEKASIKRMKGDEVVSSLEAAPNVSGDGKLVDLTFFLRTMDGDTLNTGVTLADGMPVEVGTFLKDGVERKVAVTAEVSESGEE